jgi:hypothetical protein
MGGCNLRELRVKAGHLPGNMDSQTCQEVIRRRIASVGLDVIISPAPFISCLRENGRMNGTRTVLQRTDSENTRGPPCGLPSANEESIKSSAFMSSSSLKLSSPPASECEAKSVCPSKEIDKLPGVRVFSRAPHGRKQIAFLWYAGCSLGGESTYYRWIWWI